MTRLGDVYLGAGPAIDPHAIAECQICWTPYDPEHGDRFRQIDPGTPFAALPDEWCCPKCDAPKSEFLLRSSRDSQDDAAAQAARLVADFQDLFTRKMRDVPLINSALEIEAVGFRIHAGRPVGVLVTPWLMSIVALPAGGEDWSTLVTGTAEYLPFPSGEYEFTHNRRERTGGYKACTLFASMRDFTSQEQAVAVAHRVLAVLFNEAQPAGEDRQAAEATEHVLTVGQARTAKARVHSTGD
ncbi:MAG: [NiFe]-hydrogenase assembly chaperone HybE [Pseudomonadota bacterium]